jgi:hypothetical protein
MEPRYFKLRGDFFRHVGEKNKCIKSVDETKVRNEILRKLAVRSGGQNKFDVGFEVLTSVVTKSHIFWDIPPCSPLKVNRQFEATFRLYIQLCLLPASRWFLAWLILRPLRWRQHVPPKADFQRTTRCYIPEDKTLHIGCENLKFYKYSYISLKKALSFNAERCVGVEVLGLHISPSNISSCSQHWSSRGAEDTDNGIELSLDKKQKLEERW